MLFHFLSSSQHDFSSHFLYNVIHFHKFNKMTKSQIYLLREGQTCVIIEEKLEEGDTMGKVQENKQQKRQALLDAAYDLFLEQGLNKTSIDSIVHRAKVAKGTFYLYFSDKDAILQALMWRISEHIFDEALAEVAKLGQVPFSQKELALVDYIIEYLRRNSFLLRLIRHSLRWPSIDQLDSGEPPALFAKVFHVIRACPEMAGRNERELYQRLTAIVSMCISVCYGCVIEHSPDTLDNMKPVLYDIIKKSL